MSDANTLTRSDAIRLTKRSERPTPLLDNPPLGHLQAIIMKKIDRLAPEAGAHDVLEELSLENLVWLDPSQVYNAIRKMVKDNYLELIGVRRSKGVPPTKIYRLTAPGREALDATLAHHQAVADYLRDKPKRP